MKSVFFFIEIFIVTLYRLIRAHAFICLHFTVAATITGTISKFLLEERHSSGHAEVKIIIINYIKS